MPFVRATKKLNKLPKKPARVLVPEGELPFRKMSEVLAELAAPLLRTTTNERDARSALRLVMAAWNEGTKGSSPIENEKARAALASYFGDTWRKLRPVFDELVQERATTYPHDPRIIAGVQARLLPSGRLEISTDSTW